MRIHEKAGELVKMPVEAFRRMPTAVKLGGLLASLALLSGCGGDSKLSTCPAEYYRDHAPVNPGKTFDELQYGVAALRNKIRHTVPANGYEYVPLQNISPRDEAAARDIFYQGGDGDSPEGSLRVGTAGTKLDELEEVFCSRPGDEYFLTPDAEMAIADLYPAGIAVEIVPPHTDPSNR